MDWWQEIDCGNRRQVGLPTHAHWSRRFGRDPETLWASYMRSLRKVTIYLGEGHGILPRYKELRTLSKDDYALLPARYTRAWFMRLQQ